MRRLWGVIGTLPEKEIVMRNLAKWDRGLRVVVAAVAAVLAVVLGPGGVTGIVLWAVTAIMLGTAAVGYCPLYSLLRINTCAVKRGHPGRPTHA
ncbi:MAG: DUF2892 domain-containing protein [Actinomycetota bacterium]